MRDLFKLSSTITTVTDWLLLLVCLFDSVSGNGARIHSVSKYLTNSLNSNLAKMMIIVIEEIKEVFL